MNHPALGVDEGGGGLGGGGEPHGGGGGVTRNPESNLGGGDFSKSTSMYADSMRTMGGGGSGSQTAETQTEAEKRKKRYLVVVSAASYCLSSTTMVLVNKVLLSSYSFSCPVLLLLFQATVAVFAVVTLNALGVIRTDPISATIIRLWVPAILLFVLQLWSSFGSLKSLGVAMVTVLKNLTNLLTICGEYVVFGRMYGIGVWSCLALMTISAISGAYTDLSFTRSGYMWQIGNCVFTASYSIYLRLVMDRVQFFTGKKLSESTMVLLNNGMSIPCLLLLAHMCGETTKIYEPLQLATITDLGFQAAAIVSSFTGLALSYSSIWFLSSSTPTTYSIVGSLNKIPIALLGIIIFSAPTTWANMISISIGLFAGIVFVKAKASESQRKQDGS